MKEAVGRRNSRYAALTGCSSIPDRGAARTGYDSSGIIAGADVKLDLNDTSLVKDILYAQYREWKGTRYQLRGLSKDGIDCSGFVHITFKSKLGANPTEVERPAGGIGYRYQ